MKTISLNGTWQLRGKPQYDTEAKMIMLPATVPGCVQLDLSKAGYLPEDLYMGMNITQTEKYEGYEWWYESSFVAPDERERVFIVFEGVDCVAEYFINGKKIGESENMFISHEFEIGSYLRDGENTLTVHISSPLLYTHKFDFPVRHFENWGNDLVNTAIRRAPHSYGWDIMPRAVTSGIWREVRIEVRDRIYFSQLFINAAPDSYKAYCQLECDWELLKSNTVEIELMGSCGEDSSFYARHTVARGNKSGKIAFFHFNVGNAKLWMPYGYGDANVYDGEARIYENGKLVHSEPISFGIRSVKLERTDTTDGKNGCFRFLINGIEIMAKGSNWVPMDVFHSRDAERYGEALALVKDIGCNILRCWGGNVYEDHKFFDFCDRNGIMVWQDFAMACASYPQDDRFKKLITDEATAVIRKLRNHPSIILWSGDNEVDQLCLCYGGDPSKNKITREWLPAVVDLNDPSRTFLPSSPYIAPNADMSTVPENHAWGPRDYYKSDYYKRDQAHFISETGYHGCPSLESIKRFITPESVWPYANNPEWILHSSDQCGNDGRVMLMEKQVAQLFGEVPTDPKEYILASQISQAEAKKYFIERMRAGRPYKSGIIWWNLLDGWPQMSDAVVDYYYSKKLAYYYIKRSQAPFTIVAGELASWQLPIYACNDTLTEKQGHFTVKDAESNALIYEGDFVATANSTVCVANLPIFYSDQRMLIFEWKLGEERGFNHFLCGYPAFSLKKYCELIRKHRLGE